MGFKLDDLPFEKGYLGPVEGYEDGFVAIAPEGTEVIRWTDLEKRTLYDYNVIIGNFETLNSYMIDRVASKRSQMLEFLNAEQGGLLIIFAARFTASSSSDSELDNYHILPLSGKFSVADETSQRQRIVTKGPFAPILVMYEGQEFYFQSLPKTCHALSVNRKGKALSFETSVGKGTIIALPKIPNKREALSHILDQILPEFGGVPEPAWLNKIHFLDEQKLQKNANELIETIHDYRKWKSLLYGTGGQLLAVTKRAMQKLGVSIRNPDHPEDHDFEIILGENLIGVTEVTGSTTRIDLDKLRQNLDHQLKMQQDHPELTIKGIMIVNSEREKEPGTRGPPCTDKALKRAQDNHMCLVTTTKLFALLEESYQGTFSTEAFLQALKSTEGILK